MNEPARFPLDLGDQKVATGSKRAIVAVCSAGGGGEREKERVVVWLQSRYVSEKTGWLCKW